MAAISAVSAASAAGLASRPRLLASRSIPASPSPMRSSGRMARSRASITGDMGVARDGSHKDSYTPGIALVGKYTLLAEGARGSLTKQLIRRFSLDAESGPQKYGIGLKELWEIPKEKHRPGLVQHTMGWPLQRRHRRRLVPLPFRREFGFGRLRRASRLRQSLSQPIQGISARQDPSAHRLHISKAAGAFPMARARSPRAAGRRSRALPFRAERSSAAPRAS